MGEHARHRCLAELCLPGTHDSGAYRLEPELSPPAAQQPGLVRFLAVLGRGGDHPRIIDAVRAVSQTQRRRVLEQLRDGVRLFDLRICAAGGELRIHHGLVGPPLTEVLDDVAQFLDETDGELVLLRASHFAMAKGATHGEIVSAVVDRFGERLIRRRPDLARTPLGELTRAGSRVLWFHEPDDGNRVARDDDRFWPSLSLLYRERWCRHARSAEDVVSCQGRAMAAGGSPFHLWWALTPQPSDAFAYGMRSLLGGRLFEARASPFSLERLTRRLDGGRLRAFLATRPRAPVGAISVDFYDDGDVVPLAIARSTRSD